MTTITDRQVTELHAIVLLVGCECWNAEAMEYFPEDCPRCRLSRLVLEIDPPPGPARAPFVMPCRDLMPYRAGFSGYVYCTAGEGHDGDHRNGGVTWPAAVGRAS